MDITQIIGNNIRGYRKRKKGSQKKLAMRAKLSVEFIGRVERGKIGIRIKSLSKIATALKIKPYKLVTEDAYKQK